MFRGTVVVLAAFALLSPAVAVAAAAPDELSTSDRLDARRFVTAGPRAYEVGTEAGRYPASGFHTRGEMGGILAPPIKLLDGIWFGVDGSWLPAAEKFTSGPGHVRMTVPVRAGLTVERTDFIPGDARGALIGLRFAASGAEQTFDLAVQAHSELMSAYPWGETKADGSPFTQLQVNLPDSAAASDDGNALLFTDSGTPPGMAAHDWAAAVGANVAASAVQAGAPGSGFRGPQDAAPVICPPSGPDPENKQTTDCDDTAYGKGAGEQLTYHVTVPAGGERTIWFGVGGSQSGSAG